MKIVLMVAAHKPYWMPPDPMYMPIQAGSLGKEGMEGWQRDDQGEQISGKNASFCELTCLYWLWKNVEADAYGLAHYRRHFMKERRWFSSKERQKGHILTLPEAESLLEGFEGAVVPTKRHYWIETNYTQYIHAHHKEDLLTAKEILAEKAPACIPAWDEVMQRRSGHRFNMFIMKKKPFDAYCAWLFDILFELEKRLDISAYSPKDKRVFGYVGERLLDVWLLANQVPCKEIPVVNLESQHWPSKVATFLTRKFGRR